VINRDEQIGLVFSPELFKRNDGHILLRIFMINYRISIKSMLAIYYPGGLIFVWHMQITNLNICHAIGVPLIKSPFFIEIYQYVCWKKAVTLYKLL
jgi:hypothetical protein